MDGVSPVVEVVGLLARAALLGANTWTPAERLGSEKEGKKVERLNADWADADEVDEEDADELMTEQRHRQPKTNC